MNAESQWRSGNYKREQNENTITDKYKFKVLKNVWDGLNSRQKKVEEKVGEAEDRSIEIIQSKTTERKSY